MWNKINGSCSIYLILLKIYRCTYELLKEAWRTVIWRDATNMQAGLMSHYAWSNKPHVELVGHEWLQQLCLVEKKDYCTNMLETFIWCYFKFILFQQVPTSGIIHKWSIHFTFVLFHVRCADGFSLHCIQGSLSFSFTSHILLVYA